MTLAPSTKTADQEMWPFIPDATSNATLGVLRQSGIRTNRRIQADLSELMTVFSRDIHYCVNRDGIFGCAKPVVDSPYRSSTIGMMAR